MYMGFKVDHPHQFPNATFFKNHCATVPLACTSFVQAFSNTRNDNGAKQDCVDSANLPPTNWCHVYTSSFTIDIYLC
jgi:hypothetical protein